MVIQYNDVSLLLNRESVAENVRHSKADILFEEDNILAMDILTADECLLGNKEQDDTILFGIIFKIVHKNKSAEVSYDFYSKSFDKSNNKVRTKTPSFEQMIYVADLNNPGMAFVMIFSQEQGSHMLDDLKEDTFIGTPVIVLEPFCNKGNSLQELPVIDSWHQLIPLKRSILHSVPQKLHSKPTNGELCWWLLHHTQPSWSGIHILNKNTVIQPSCAGIICDQQEIVNANGACRYFHKTARSEAAVLEGKPMSLELAPNVQLESF
jgi:hypothetical protein